MKTISIIRDRGQLTIPESVRRIVSWVAPLSAVSISVIEPDEIIIRPHQAQIDWDRLWVQIKRVRAFKGKGRGNLSSFIIQDRDARR